MKRLSILAILTPVVLAGCGGPPAADPGPPPPMVTPVSYPVEQTVIDYSDFTGRLMAVDSVQLRARVWGHLEKINFTEGAEVKRGDLLFIIDQRPYKAALARADAEVAQAEAREARLMNDQKRAQELLQSRAISREESDKIAGDVNEAKAAVRSAIAQREVAKLNLDFTEVKAPIDGQVSRALVTTGNMVSSGESGGTMLTTIVSIDPMYAYFDVDDLVVAQIKKMLTSAKDQNRDRPAVAMGLAHEKGFPHVGQLDFADNQIDPGTGTMRMRAVFKNPRRELTPGMFVRVRVPLDLPHPAILVTDRAVDTDQGQKIVFVVNKDRVVEKREVRLGKMHGGLREIASGVKSGEQVVVDGIQRIRPGMPVEPKLVPMPGQETK
jgi:RND family efflux transporter MFP subunit